jgi:hypothetical protein
MIKNGDSSLGGDSDFLLRYRIQISSGAHQAPHASGTTALSVRVKQVGGEADHSPLSSAKGYERFEIYLLPHTF